MGSLLTFLAKQTELETLDMHDNDLSPAQKDQIRQVVARNAPNCVIEFLSMKEEEGQEDSQQEEPD